MTFFTNPSRVLVLAIALAVAPAAVAEPSQRPEERPAVARTTVAQAASSVGGAPVGSAKSDGSLVAPEDDYRIGTQDLLEIDIYGIEGMKRAVRVDARGVVSLPLIGAIVVGGLTGQEAEALIASKYARDYLQDPQVSLFIKEFTSQRITVEGAVNKPGVYPIRGQTTLLQALAIAGGQGSLSDMSEVMLFRVEKGEKRTRSFDVVKIRAGELEDPTLANDDVVVVKRSQARVALKDSALRDVIDMLNPLNFLRP